VAKLKVLSTHVSMDVPDLEKTTRYLEDALGIAKQREVTVPGLGRIAFYPGLELMQASAGQQAGVVKHVAWEVEDIVAAMHELGEKGVVFETDRPQEAPFRETGEMVLYVNFTTPVGFAGELIQVCKM